MRCPHCGTELEQLGEAAAGAWTPDNLWRCRECPYGKNRFMLMGSGLMQLTEKVSG